MARITHVKKAQQRYATRPVIDPETGQQKRTPVMNRLGEQKVTKSGRPVFLRITEKDYDQPLPMPVCDHCHKPIEVGQPYKHISPKSGPYGGRTLNRHAACPTWQVWEYSNSLSARISQIQHQFSEDMAGVESEDDVTAALEEAADQARELAEEKRESAENIRDGFGHDTYQSEELDEVADNIESWADDIANTSVPDVGDFRCEECSGEGQIDEDGAMIECESCGGDTDWFDIEAWRDAVDSEVSMVEEGPML